MANNVMRQAVVVSGNEPVSIVVVAPGQDGDMFLSEYDGVVVIPDPDDGYGQDFLTLTGCSIVEITGLSPSPGVGNGWSYVDGVFIPPQPFQSWTWDGESWVAPEPKPEGDYAWDESLGQWVAA